MVDPSTVSTPKPAPRTVDTADNQPSESPSRYSGAGAPRASRPPANTGPRPRRATSRGTAAWVSTVAARNTVVTTPAAATPAPARTA